MTEKSVEAEPVVELEANTAPAPAPAPVADVAVKAAIKVGTRTGFMPAEVDRQTIARMNEMCSDWRHEIGERLKAHPEFVKTHGGIIGRLTKYLAAQAAGLSVTRARMYAGVTTGVMRIAMEMAPELLELEREAQDASADICEDEAFRRAVDGVDKPVFWQGTECGKTREYSDRLIERILKAKRPAKYADRTQTENLNVKLVYHIHGIARGTTLRTEKVIEPEAQIPALPQMNTGGEAV